MAFRVGQGYDVHSLCEGRQLILGGAEIPFAKGLLGHSDADVLAHAIMDALFGAAAMGDIGMAFPDTDDKYKGISSLELLCEAGKLLALGGWRIENIDSCVVAQEPKLGAFREEMRYNIAAALEISESCVNVKFTTEERLGFTGAGEGIAAHAICLIRACISTAF